MNYLYIILLIFLIGCGTIKTEIKNEVLAFDAISGTTSFEVTQKITVVSSNDSDVSGTFADGTTYNVDNAGNATLMEAALTSTFVNTDIQVGEGGNSD